MTQGWFVPPAAGAAGPRDGPGLRDLTTQAARGQPAAIESLLAHIRPMIVRYCQARLGRVAGDDHGADDVAQEVCLAVLSALPRYRDMGRPFASFVFGIASHKVADAVRHAATLAYGDLMADGVIDPVKVARSAVENAASIAGMLLTTEALVTDKPEKEVPADGHGHGHSHSHPH